MKKRGSDGNRPQRIGKAASERNGVMVVDAVRGSDPVCATVSAILRIVPASSWAFARVTPDGDTTHLLGSEVNGGDLADLQREFTRQRAEAKTGPRIAAALGPLGKFESAVTLLFADARAAFGILTLSRTAELGPFTSSEVSMLTFALWAASDQLSALRLHLLEDSAASRVPSDNNRSLPAQSTEAAFYVLDRDMEIVLAPNSEDQRSIALTGLRTRIADHLPAVLEEAVRDLTAAWGTEPATQAVGIARPVPFLVVRTQPMAGRTGLFIGVRVERCKPTNSLTAAASRFHLSPRELQVLALVLDGAHLNEIGSRLYITSSTVQDHIRNMVEKTESRNRTQLIASVLGWECLPQPPSMAADARPPFRSHRQGGSDLSSNAVSPVRSRNR